MCNIDDYDSDLPADAEPIGRQPQIVTFDVAHEKITERRMRATTGAYTAPLIECVNLGIRYTCVLE